MTWTKDGDHLAKRSDGVTASFIFDHNKKPYAVQRRRRGPVKAVEYLRSPNYKKIIRTFATLDAAMKAADQAWPEKRK